LRGAGRTTYDVTQHVLNCKERLIAPPCEFATRMAYLADLDLGRLLLWLFARCVQQAPSWPGLTDVAREIAPS
jgi:streptomycin 6-kinase